MENEIILKKTKRTDKRLLERMKNHYSQPKGFVGRNICYAIYYNDLYYGHIVAGSATRYLPGRNSFLGVSLKDINKVINNIFYNISPINGSYPIRNFTSSVLKVFIKRSSTDWFNKYGDHCIGFETLVELPRKGDLYLRAGWKQVGVTKGFTCKRVNDVNDWTVSKDSWSGRRVWNMDEDSLRPKNVLCFKL